MVSLLIGIGVVLVLIILYLIFRVGSLISLARTRPADEDDRVDSSNDLNAGLFLVFMVVSLGGFFWYSWAYFDDYNLPVASEHGVRTDALFWITMAVSVIAFVIISIIAFIFMYQYRYKKDRKASFYPDNHRLELAWTIIPAVVLAILIFTGLRAWNDITDPASPDAEVIEVIAQQFAWNARYPGADNTLGNHNYMLIDDINQLGLDLSDANSHDDFQTQQLYIPKGKEVLLKIRAKDVLHSLYIPHFRVKMDAVPGMITQFKFIATKTTQEMRDERRDPNFVYELACAEICGRGHFSMRMEVIVVEPAEYDRWKGEQKPWLRNNPGYLEKVPAELREAAMIKAGLTKDPGPVAQNVVE